MSHEKPLPIPVLAIIRDAIAIPWRKREVMFRALIPISLVLISLRMIPHPFLSEPPGTFYAFICYLVSGLPIWLALAVFAVTCHRLILLGNKSVPRYGLTNWSSRETRFVGWIVLGYVCVLVLVPVIGIPVLGLVELFKFPAMLGGIVAFLSVYIPSTYVVCRLSILLPATAVDERFSIKWARDVTENNGWRLVLVVGVLPLVLKLGPRHVLGHSVIVDLLVTVVEYVLYVVEIAALSLSYQHLTGRRAHGASSPVETVIGVN